MLARTSRFSRSMTEIGMTGAELRMVFGKNIVDLTDEELDRAIAIVPSAGWTSSRSPRRC